MFPPQSLESYMIEVRAFSLGDIYYNESENIAVKVFRMFPIQFVNNLPVTCLD